MDYWKQRQAVLRIINIVYGLMFNLLMLIFYAKTNRDYFGLQWIGAGVAVILAMVFLLSFFRKLEKAYQNVLYFSLWCITILTTNYAYLADQGTFFFIHIMLLVATVFSIFNIRMIRIFIMIYVAFTYPVLVVCDYEVTDKLLLFFVATIVLALAYLKSIYDFSVFKRYELAENSNSLLLNNAKEGFALHEIIIDEEGRPVDYKFLAVNDAFEAMTGLVSSEIIGRRVLDIMPQTEKYWIETYGEVALKGVNRHFENYASALDRYYEVSAYPVGDKKFATLFTDITERIKAERNLKYAVKRAKNAMELKNQFLKDVNHRLRTPLNGMMGMIQLIDESSLDLENAELFKAMKEEMLNSRNILNQISKYVETQGRKFELTKVDILKVVDDVISQYKHVRVRISEVQCNDDMLVVEKSVLESVLHEVLGNAAKYTLNEKVSVSIVCTKNEERQLDYFRVAVTDYGPGIPPEEQDYIFNEFYHHDFIHIYRDDDKLSLPLCKQILNSCGGDLLLESILGDHTTFVIELPVYKF